MRTNKYILSFLVLLFLCLVNPDAWTENSTKTNVPSKDQSKKSEDGFIPLFNGKDFSGWKPINTAPSTWSIKDSMIHCTGKPIGELRTVRMYQNFIMEVEWRHLKPRGNAGIFIWADDITAKGQPFHRGIEVQVLENAYGNTRSYTTHGDIFPIHGAKMTPTNGRGGSRSFPTENRSNPSPKWNHYRITCIDGTIKLEVNGKLVNEGRNCSPRKGYICLESEGGIVDYRNLRIKELPGKPVPKEHVAIADRGYKCLYTGVDLSGWKVAQGNKKNWQVRDWVLGVHASQGTSTILESEKSFGNFGFIVDFKIKDKTQLLNLGLRGGQNAIIELFPITSPNDKAIANKNRWNRIEGKVIGDELSYSINGKEVAKGLSFTRNQTKGAIFIEAQGQLDLSNIYVRKIKK